jgi:hypothetical protein
VTDPLHIMGAQTGAVEQAGKWSAWDWIRWGAPFLVGGLAVGAILTAFIDYFIP